MSAEDIQFFFHLRDQIKLYHWQTKVYARHIATDKALSELDKSIDSFVEIYIAKYGRPKMSTATSTVRVQNLSEAGAKKLIQAAVKYLQGPLTRHINKIDTDLINIRDELIAELNQLLYLFTLH